MEKRPRGTSQILPKKVRAEDTHEEMEVSSVPFKKQKSDNNNFTVPFVV